MEDHRSATIGSRINTLKWVRSDRGRVRHVCLDATWKTLCGRLEGMSGEWWYGGDSPEKTAMYPLCIDCDAVAVAIHESK
jgi:hypothetical protein